MELAEDCLVFLLPSDADVTICIGVPGVPATQPPPHPAESGGRGVAADAVLLFPSA